MSIGKGKQWVDNNKLISTDITNWDNFKRSDFFYKIALWNPDTNGLRYLKFLLYNCGLNMNDKQFFILDKIDNRNIGNPYSVKINNRQLDFDYLQAVHEIYNIDSNMNLNKINSILEIGAGYGRTCHSMLCNYDNISEYNILDLDEMIGHSKLYLKEVLDVKLYKKINFISVDKLDEISNKKFDLAIQIDGFNEMDIQDVYFYLDYIDNHCNYFYTKNPVGKYFDKSLDNHWSGQSTVDNALKSGILTDIIDIDDNIIVEENGNNKFISSFTPSNNWRCIYSGQSVPISFYWEALYEK